MVYHWISLIGCHLVDLHVNGNNVIYFKSFGVEHISKEIKRIIAKKYHNKYLQNTNIRFNNMWTFLYWIY